jgi:hypothetical protein
MVPARGNRINHLDLWRDARPLHGGGSFLTVDSDAFGNGSMSCEWMNVCAAFYAAVIAHLTAASAKESMTQ